jgi:hypothetical protein
LLKLDASKVHLFKELGKEINPVRTEQGTIAPLGDRLYLETDIKKEYLIQAFQQAEII